MFQQLKDNSVYSTVILEYNHWRFWVIVTELEWVEDEICYVISYFEDWIQVDEKNSSSCPDIISLIKEIDGMF